jgi:hypothetical protein
VDDNAPRFSHLELTHAQPHTHMHMLESAWRRHKRVAFSSKCIVLASAAIGMEKSMAGSACLSTQVRVRQHLASGVLAVIDPRIQAGIDAGTSAVTHRAEKLQKGVFTLL